MHTDFGENKKEDALHSHLYHFLCLSLAAWAQDICEHVRALMCLCEIHTEDEKKSIVVHWRGLPLSNTSEWSWFKPFEILCNSSKYIIPEICTTYTHTTHMHYKFAIGDFCFFFASLALAIAFIFICLFVYLAYFVRLPLFCIKFWLNISTAEWVMGWNLCKHNNRKWRGGKTYQPGVHIQYVWKHA